MASYGKKGMMGMSSKNWNRVAFFALGTFLGGWVLGLVGGILGAGRKG